MKHKQYVELNGLKSETSNTISGVPQGSVLGPLLFTIFVNDFNSAIADYCKTFMYADDIYILITGKKHYEDVFQAKINFVLKEISVWVSVNRLTINVKKTKALGFNIKGSAAFNIRLDGTNIQLQDNMNCLGIIIDNKLNFEEHLNFISRRINYLLCRLYSTYYHLPTKVKCNLASAILVSIISYGLEVYSGSQERIMSKVNVLMNKIVRYTYNLRRFQHCSPYVELLLGCNFNVFVSSRLICLAFKILKFQTPFGIASNFQFSKSRRNPQMLIPKLNNNVYEKSFMVRVARIWNKLPKEFKKFTYSPGFLKNSLRSLLSE